jgi:alpha-galactosidase
MLSQTGGSIGSPEDLSVYTDREHYRIPHQPGVTTVYGLLMLSAQEKDRILMGFTSCRRFSGEFRINEASIEVVVDTEGLRLNPGESWDLEEFYFQTGSDREVLLEGLAKRIQVNHPPLPVNEFPTGWCSWYYYFEDATEEDILKNVKAIAQHVPSLRYIQIDDGYQAAMGDWLESGPRFPNGVASVLARIGDEGFRPGIWVAPFIAQKESRLFSQHPDWFIKDDNGEPLASDTVSFGGWRLGPWYALDGTHPEVQTYLEELFRTMRVEWGVTYFKLDATVWGALHGGHFQDQNATRIEAYRKGMEAILRGVGEGAYVLSGNQPMWASLGLTHGSRISLDIQRSWKDIARTARENFYRNWQNGRLWINDPDCLVLDTKTVRGPVQLTSDEILFHATATFAAGGAIISSDDIGTLPPEKLAMLRKFLPPTRRAARFTDESFRIGRIDQKDQQLVFLFNWGDAPDSMSVELDTPRRIVDFWTDEELGVHEVSFRTEVAAHGARQLVLMDAD